MKVVLRYCESNSGVILKPQWPLIFDLIDDPSEETDLIDKRLDGARVMRPAAMALGALAQSAAQYPTSSQGRSSPVPRRLTVEHRWSTNDLSG